jgi:microcystin-dependent protein
MAVYYINGTSNSGATFGQSGYFYPLYLTSTEANSASDNTAGTSHPHTFEEAPNITFYMPVEDAAHAQSTAPSGSYSGELYISYTSPIAEIDVEEIGTGVLASDTFNSWRKKTNDVARETIANKASIGSVDTRLTRLLSVTGGENNIMTLSSSDNITGEKEFEGLVKFTAADDLANAVQVGTDGKLYVSSSKFFFDKDVDLHEAGAELKASNLDLPTGKTKYAGVQYTWPSQAPIPGQILKSAPGNTLTWATEAAAEATVEAFLIEDPNPIGSVLQWTTNTPPSKWLICNGDAVSRTTYSNLFAVIGETYGAGDGTTTFNLPDLRARVPVGRGTNTDVNNLSAAFETLGSSQYVVNNETLGGEYQHTLTENETPIHKHFIATNGSTNTGILSSTNQLEHAYNYGEDGSVERTNPNFEYILHGATDDANLGLTSSFGGDQSHNVVQPFIVLNYIIKAEGSTIVEQNITPSNGILINDAAAQTNLLGAGSVNTIKMDVDSNDFEFSGNTLKIKDDSTSVHTQIDAKIKTVSIETDFGLADASHSVLHNLGGVPSFFNAYVKFKTSNNTLGWSQGDMVPLFNGEVWSSEGRIFSSGMNATSIYWAYGGSSFNNIRISTPLGHGVLTPNSTDHALVINATRYV